MVGGMSEVEGPYLDRRVPEKLVRALEQGGPLGFIAGLAADNPLLDPHLRADQRKHPGVGKVTLYVGLTKAFDIAGRDDGKLQVILPNPLRSPGEEAQRHRWTNWLPADELAGPEFEDWTARMVSAAETGSPGKALNEGAIQAIVSRGVEGWFQAIDRETEFAFVSQAEKDCELARIRAPLRGLADRLRDPDEKWTLSPPKPAAKLDVLGVDRKGRVLVIEVKPGSQTGSLGWTPYQVAQYMALSRAWRLRALDAGNCLTGVFEQRKRLGAIGPGSWEIAEPLQLVPVIAVGLPVKSKVGPQRMAVVCEAARKLEPELLEGLEVWAVHPSADRNSADEEPSVRQTTIDALYG